MLTWIDWLKVPMAAPETRALKFMRFAILGVCLMLIVSIAAIDPLRAAIGICAGAVVAGLLLALIVLVPIYMIAKTRADDAYFAALLASTDR